MLGSGTSTARRNAQFATLKRYKPLLAAQVRRQDRLEVAEHRPARRSAAAHHLLRHHALLLLAASGVVPRSLDEITSLAGAGGEGGNENSDGSGLPASGCRQICDWPRSRL